MPKWIKSKNMEIQHVQGCAYVLIDMFCISWNKYAQHGYRVSIFKYEQHVILN